MLPCQDFDRFPWLELVGSTAEDRAHLVLKIRDKALASTSRAARRRLERETRR